MYSVDEQDRVIELKDVPQSDTGAPSPAVLSNERVTLLVYLVQQKPFPFDGRVLTDADVEMFRPERALIEFHSCRSYMFGSPNDEAFAGHPLSGRGLHPYGAYENQNSSWIRQLERMNSVHSSHDPKRFEGLRHFIFAFHDSTFECVAESYTFLKQRGNWADLLLEMERRIGWVK